MLLMIDNYDSFTFNIVMYLRELGQEVLVKANNEILPDQISAMQPRGIVISPGPKRPEEAGISMAVVAEYGGRIPILGVCLGHQCIAQSFGAKVVRASQVMHGKTSRITHRGEGLFRTLPTRFEVARYHSLIVSGESLPVDLVVDAWTEADEPGDVSGEIMALRHRSLPLWGVQFHPEAILTEHGHALLKNFIGYLGESV